MDDVPMGDIPPGVIGRVERHQGEVIQMFLPNVLPAVDDASGIFQDLFPGSTTFGTQVGVLVDQLPRQPLVFLRLMPFEVQQKINAITDVARPYRTSHAPPLIRGHPEAFPRGKFPASV